jgi:broad specificity phosphatase PhoE
MVGHAEHGGLVNPPNRAEADGANADRAKREVVLIRHGATEWSENGRHTGSTDLPLLPEGEAEATALRGRLQAWDFALVLASPLQRAQETARLAGLGDRAVTEPALREWDYGNYEGRTTADIRKERPGWTVWNGGCGPDGEDAEQVGARADAVLERVLGVDGAVALVSHGQFLRVLIARWLEQPAAEGSRYALRTATLSVLGYERETRVLCQLNA